MTDNNKKIENNEQEIRWLSSAYELPGKCRGLASKFEPRDLKLYRIDEITFEDESPRQEALENVIASMKFPGINLIYLILGKADRVNFYFGISHALDESVDGLSIDAIGKDVLQKSLKGNFRGSKISAVASDELQNIKNYIASENLNFAVMEGVPGTYQDKEKKDFQGVDRLVDIMLGDEFGMLVIAKPLCNPLEFDNLVKNLDDVYRQIMIRAKQQLQTGTNSSTNDGTTTTKGIQEGTQESKNYSSQQNKQSSHSDSVTRGISEQKGGGYTPSGGGHSTNDSKGTNSSGGTNDTVGWSEGTTTGQNVGITRSISDQLSRQVGTQDGESNTLSFEIVNKNLQEWTKFFDEVIFPRLDCALGKGLFVSSTLIFSPKKPVLTKLSNVMKSIFSGELGNRTPLHAIPLEKDSPRLTALQSFQQPILDLKNSFSENGKLLEECRAATVHSKCFRYTQDGKIDDFYAGNWMSVVELGKIAGIPRKEVVGLRLREEVEFGLNVDDQKNASPVEIGKLLQSGNPTDIPVNLDAREFDRHMFIAGVTGSGKTTTCQNILRGSKRNFLVIEPAKTEYRILLQNDDMKDLLVFTLGDDKVAPFRLNPLEFLPGESISSRVDMIMASISAAFDMDAAIPQLIEQAIYECYKIYGWNIRNDTNHLYGEKAFDNGIYAFPTLSDILKVMPKVIADQGFDERLHDEYLGSIRARLGSLTIGAKGAMLNCKRSIDFEDLLSKKVVFELEDVRSGSEKSLIIGFILTNLLVAIKHKFDKDNKKIEHCTLIEEAHRLMSKFQPGDNPNKKHAVETFADMLAEIRKYGESMIIADQIPNKLTPDVLKNTNIKIVHRIFAQDDKDAIGATMSLSEEQRNFLSNLEVGHAIVFSGNWPKAIHTQITKATDTSSTVPIEKATLREKIFAFYTECYNRGIFAGIEKLDRKPNQDDFENYVKYIQNEDVSDFFSYDNLDRKNEYLKSKAARPYKELFRNMFEKCGADVASTAIAALYLRPDNFDERVEALKTIIPRFYTETCISSEEFPQWCKLETISPKIRTRKE